MAGDQLILDRREGGFFHQALNKRRFYNAGQHRIHANAARAIIGARRAGGAAAGGVGAGGPLHEGACARGFSGGSDHALVLRYGAQSDYAVQSTPDLRRPLPPPGPLFKLDIDSFWQAADEVPEFDAELILRQADALHEPVRGVFESVITDRLREEVLRND